MFLVKIPESGGATAPFSTVNLHINPDWGWTVVWWLALSPHGMRVLGSHPDWDLPVWSLCVLHECLWVLSGYYGFLTLTKNIHVRLIGDSKLTLGVSVSMDGCLSLLSLCGPVMDWRLVQGCTLPPAQWQLKSLIHCSINITEKIFSLAESQQ